MTQQSAEQVTQDWCDPELLAAVRQQITDEGGPSYYLVDYAIDHRESVAAQRFTVTLAPSVFGDYSAAKCYFERYPGALTSLRERVHEGGIQKLVQHAPPSVIGMHVNVVSSDDRFLIIQRSGAVREYQGEWMVGPGETLTANPSVPGAIEDFFELARRALDEEVGLKGGDYGPIHITWLGMHLDCAAPLVIAHVRSSLMSHAIEGRISQAHSVFEAEACEWVALKRRAVSKLFDEMTASNARRKWHAGAPIVLQELWRSRSLLDYD